MRYEWCVNNQDIWDNKRKEKIEQKDIITKLNEYNQWVNQLINSDKYWESKAKQKIGELKAENIMLKNTIKRNEAYIKRLTTTGIWSKHRGIKRLG